MVPTGISNTGYVPLVSSDHGTCQPFSDSRPVTPYEHTDPFRRDPKGKKRGRSGRVGSGEDCGTGNPLVDCGDTGGLGVVGIARLRGDLLGSRVGR